MDDCPPRTQYEVGGALVSRLDVDGAASLPSGEAAHVLTPSTTFAILARRFTLLRVVSRSRIQRSCRPIGYLQGQFPAAPQRIHWSEPNSGQSSLQQCLLNIRRFKVANHGLVQRHRRDRCARRSMKSMASCARCPGRGEVAVLRNLSTRLSATSFRASASRRPVSLSAIPRRWAWSTGATAGWRSLVGNTPGGVIGWGSGPGNDRWLMNSVMVDCSR